MAKHWFEFRNRRMMMILIERENWITCHMCRALTLEQSLKKTRAESEIYCSRLFMAFAILKWIMAIQIIVRGRHTAIWKNSFTAIHFRDLTHCTLRLEKCFFYEKIDFPFFLRHIQTSDGTEYHGKANIYNDNFPLLTHKLCSGLANFIDEREQEISNFLRNFKLRHLC